MASRKKSAPQPEPFISPLSEKHFETTGAPVNYRDSWRIFRIVTEIVEGYQFLSQLHKEVIVLGSARLPHNNKYYKIAEEFGRLLGKGGFTTITGGGPGIMEAANKGAHEVGGESVGLNIQLPFEQRINPYVKKSASFYYFFTRKVMLTSPGNAFVFFPGGFGTLDEFFEVVDYMELGYMDKAPIVLVGSEFWKPLLRFLREKVIKEVHALEERQIENWHIVDTAEEAYELIKNTEDRPNVCDNNPSNPLCADGSTDWRVFRILSELVDGFEFLTTVKHNVTVLGTKNILPGSPYYTAAYELGKLLAKSKHGVMTGGGPGVIEAANKGAFEAGGESIGLGLHTLNNRDRLNNYVNKSLTFVYPFVRKLIITSPSEAFVFFPGGFGTLHQLFEILTLLETKKMQEIPVFVYGKDFWKPLMDYVHQLHVEFKTISEIDETFMRAIDDPSEVLRQL